MPTAYSSARYTNAKPRAEVRHALPDGQNAMDLRPLARVSIAEKLSPPGPGATYQPVSVRPKRRDGAPSQSRSA